MNWFITLTLAILDVIKMYGGDDDVPLMSKFIFQWLHVGLTETYCGRDCQSGT